MTKENPITPPPELIHQWAGYAKGYNIPGTVIKYIATQAARWGADQELEACCEWLKVQGYPGTAIELRDTRRPKPPSLKAQALKELKDWTDEKHGLSGEVFLCEGLSVALIREALESLPD